MELSASAACPCCVVPTIIGFILVTWLLVYSLTYKFKSAWFTYTARFLGFVVLSLSFILGIVSSSEDLSARLFAKLFVQLSKSQALDEHRCALLSGIKGRVLEIGPGPGTNLRCWENNANIVEWVGIDSNKYFEAPLEAERVNRNITFPMSVMWMSSSGENLTLVAESFDAVVGTHVLCSVSDIEGVFSTISHALKPSGRYYLLEHVAAENGSVLRFVQLIFEPLFTIIGNGCKFKQTANDLDRSKERGGVFFEYHFNISEMFAPIELPFLRPHLYGIITKPAKATVK